MNNYPTADHDMLLAKLDISPETKILDVGGGGNPFKYADVVVDMDFNSENKHRDGCNVLYKKDKFCVQANIEALPFKENTFDFVICLQVLEHVQFPNKACEELIRVAKKGFIETPRKWTEYYAGHPTHRWLIDNSKINKNKIIFEPILYNKSPFINFALPVLWESKELQKQAFFEFSEIPNIQLYWENKFEYEITEHLPERVKQDNFIAESHYCFAKNLLFWMSGSDTGAFHANIAKKIIPNSDKYQKLVIFYSILTGSFKDILALKQKRKLKFKYIGYVLTCRVLRFANFIIKKLYKKVINIVTVHEQEM